MSDAWRYCDNLSDPEAVKELVQAVLTAHATISFAQTQVGADGADGFATIPDWKAVQRSLRSALKAVGHPAGERGTP